MKNNRLNKSYNNGKKIWILLVEPEKKDRRVKGDYSSDVLHGLVGGDTLTITGF